jgi:clan AA aspartic protease (TIGR02281 family)
MKRAYRMQCVAIAALVGLLGFAPGVARASFKAGMAAFARRDYVTARQEYLEAALDGNPLAQNNLAYLYLHGLGGPVDLSGALDWFARAAELGQANAQCSLADMYETGEAGVVDYAKALYWYRRAAVSGFFIAQYSLGLMLEAGRGTAPRPVEALAWYLLATQAPPAPTNRYYGEEYRKAVKTRDELEQRLTASEQAKARTLTADWTPGHDLEAPLQATLIQRPQGLGKHVGEATQRVQGNREVIPLDRHQGTYSLPVQINGAITLEFTLDSGASDVSVPADVASTLVRTGTLSRRDFIGEQTYELADGSALPSQRVMIRSLKVGDIELKNVPASIVPASAGLLLGQSFLKRLRAWTIDNRRHALIVSTGP